MSEPTELTQVVDAFDGGDPFDVNLSVGFQQTWKSANVRRETYIAQPGLTTGGYISDALNVAKFRQRISRLNTRVDVGLWHDVAVYARMPIILADSRKLSSLDGSEGAQALVARGLPGEQLFSIPFKSPTRSGIEYLALGLDFGIMNQARDPAKPTWLFGLEGRFNISEPMHACNASEAALNQSGGAQRRCAFPSDYDRDGVADPGVLEGSFSGTPEAGVSRGVTGLEVFSFMSRRIKYVEPYGGFRALFEFPVGASDYGQTDLEGSLVNHPPLRGSMIAGLAIIPWEIRERFQRITVDVRFVGTYVSEGRDYSELFDALGSSDAPSLRQPLPARYTGTSPQDSHVDPDAGDVYFTGITDVQQYGEYSLSGRFTWQAGEYVKFNFGLGYLLVQNHIVTFDQACNPDLGDDLGASGPCQDQATNTATGIPNPNFRRAVNSPGYRFKVDDGNGLEGWLNATLMF